MEKKKDRETKRGGGRGSGRGWLERGSWEGVVGGSWEGGGEKERESEGRRGG